MPINGTNSHFTPYSLAKRADVEQAIQRSRNTSIRALLIMLLGDPKWLGSKRSCFRLVELAPIPTDPESMQVDLTAGSALMQDGEDHTGDWYLCFADTGDKSIVLSESHPTLDRYDIIYAVPGRTNSGTVDREIIDAQGNVSIVTDHELEIDTFTLGVLTGTPGAAAPAITRLDAYTALPVGQIPIALIKVRAATSQILITDITDLREQFIPRLLPIGLTVTDDLKALQGDITHPNTFAQPVVVWSADGLTSAPRDSFIIDKTGGSPGTLKYKKDDDSIVTLE